MSAIQQVLLAGKAAPANTVAPAVTGTAQTGSTLSCSTGTWLNDPTSYAYQWQHGGVNIGGATSSTYVVSTAYVGEQIRCNVTATNAAGSVVASSNSTAAVVLQPGQQAFTTPGDTTWTAPAGCTNISLVLVGAAYQGYGGNLAYRNNYAVTPGNVYNIRVGTANNGGTGASYFISAATIKAGIAQEANVGATGGGLGGAPYGPSWEGGGGAGGYSGNGGNGESWTFQAATAGAGGGGGGGASNANEGGGGGGVGILGAGSNGAAAGSGTGNGGSGGSGGANGGNAAGGDGGGGGLYGGGGGGSITGNDHPGAGGAVRIIWPGNTRSFPSTNTGNL
jgi:hypothetical protein